MMNREIVETKRKAVKINLSKNIYGTFAEIGAGQEVARNFFTAGGASGTIAKTMSAYDMTFSDAIYGEEKSGRYVTDTRLLKMLDHEFSLLKQRLVGEKYESKTLFAFADTVTTLNFTRTNDPHGWLGVRFQLEADGEPNDIIIHVRLLGDQALVQQKVLGVIGVNLIFASYWYHKDPELLLESLIDNLSLSQITIDAVKISGPQFKDLDNRLLALWLVKKGLTQAVIFDPNGQIVNPKDHLYKKNILILRGRFRPVTKVNMDMLKTGLEHFRKDPQVDPDNIELLFEITMLDLRLGDEVDIQDFLDRADILCALGHKVLISNYHEHFSLIKYLARCKPSRMGIIIGILNIIQIYREKYIDDTIGNACKVLRAFTEVFTYDVKMLVYPYQRRKGGTLINTKNLIVPDNVKHLFKHLVENNFFEDIEHFDDSTLQIFADEVLDLIQTDDSAWQEKVPPVVSKIIKDKKLFGYRSRVAVKG